MPHGDVTEAELHPERRGEGGHLLECDAGVSRARLGVGDFDGEDGQVAGVSFEIGDRVGPQRQVVDGGDLAGDAVVSPEVGSVGERLVVDFDDPVVEGAGVERRAGL